VARCKVDV